MGQGSSAGSERRQHRRVPITTSVGCRRLGRRGFDERVETVDLSVGGMLLVADRRLDVGDVLALSMDAPEAPVALRGLVVAVRPAPGRAKGARYVHVAFTGISPERLEAVCLAIDRLAPEAAG